MNEIINSRIKQLSKGSGEGSCVLYVMSRDQRVQDNHALLAAQKHALAKKLPLAVVFCLQNKTGNRAREHYEFMLAGLREVESSLNELGIPFMMVIGDPKEKLAAVFHHTKPDAVYFDFNPLRGPKSLVTHFAGSNPATRSNPAIYVVDTHNIVPVWVASSKQEYAAYTLRPKLHRLLGMYLVEPEQPIKHPHIWPGLVHPMAEIKDLIDAVVQKQPSNRTKISWPAGSSSARAHLEDFIVNKLDAYGVDRNKPAQDGQSNLSPYLHFGQISSLRVALRLQEESVKLGSDMHLLLSPKMPQPEGKSTQQHSIDALLEEIGVRKELADNFCYYCPDYDNLNAAPNWARLTLEKHKPDVRDYLYTYEQFEKADTHDDIWNLAQKQLVTTGKMHGYLRMYWAKKVLEWTESPEQAIEFLVKLNDFYSIDGGDPNGYAGILWCVAGVHDRPWFNRPIFGAIRYMGQQKLKKMFY